MPGTRYILFSPAGRRIQRRARKGDPIIAALVSQLLAIGLGCSGCSVAEPITTPSKAPAVLASVAAVSDSACRVLDVTLDKSVAVEPAWFKDDSSYLDRSAG